MIKITKTKSILSKLIHANFIAIHLGMAHQGNNMLGPKCI